MPSTVTEAYPGYVADLEHAVASLRDALKDDLDAKYWEEAEEVFGVVPSLADYVLDPRERNALRAAISRSVEHSTPVYVPFSQRTPSIPPPLKEVVEYGRTHLREFNEAHQ